MKTKYIILMSFVLFTYSCFYPNSTKIKTDITPSVKPSSEVLNNASQTPSSVPSEKGNSFNSPSPVNSPADIPTSAKTPAPVNQSPLNTNSSTEAGNSSASTGSSYLSGTVKEDINTKSTPVPSTYNDQNYQSQGGVFLSGKVKE